MNKEEKVVQEKKKEPKTKNDKTKKPRSLTGILLATSFVISFVIIAAVIYMGKTGLQKIEEQNTLLHTQQLEIKQLSSKQSLVSQDVQEQLNANTLAQNTELTTLKETITAFLKQNQYSRRDWLVAESEYLVKLANHRLILSRDVTTSIEALRAADDRLREIGNPKYIPLRKALSLNIQQLKAIPQIDVVGISSSINALQQQVEKLPLHTPIPETIEQRNEEPLAISQIDDWKKFPSAIWNDLLKLVRIQHHDEAVQPLLSPEQRFFLVQNLKLQLEQARSALLNNHPSIYKDRLQQAKSWVNEYFDAQASLALSFNKVINELIKKDITLTLPDISESLSKLYLLRVQSNKNKAIKKQSKGKKKTVTKKSTPAKENKKKSTPPKVEKNTTPKNEPVPSKATPNKEPTEKTIKKNKAPTTDQEAMPAATTI